jgi:pimeloyl-ACP methyl ester carboxylesterase
MTRTRSRLPTDREPSPGTLTCDGGATIAYCRRPGKLPGLLFLGGFRSDMNGTKAQALDAEAQRTGRALTRFDYRGHGASSGRFEDHVLGDWIVDGLAVLDGATEGPQVLIGSSMGAWVAVRVALARPERITGLVTIAAAPDFTEDLIWARLDEPQRRLLSEQGRIERPSNYSDEPDILTLHLIEEARHHLILRTAIALSCPVRLLHGTADGDVPWQCSLALFKRLQSDNARLSLIKDGDHRLSQPGQIQMMLATIAELAGS